MNNGSYCNLNKKEILLSELPDTPSFFTTALKLLTDAKQICICHSGFRFDPYMGVCSHLCSYCYASSQVVRYRRDNVKNIKIANIDEIKKLFKTALETDGKVNVEGECIRHNYPVRIGTQTDSMQLAEEKYGITYRFIDEIMNKYNYPYILCTKNKRVADDKYMELYEKGNGNCAFQFTLSTLNQQYLDIIERGASKPKERLLAINKLSSKGYRTSCRISPYVPEYMSDVEDLCKALADNGCKHIICEILRVNPIINKIMIEECGYDVARLYKQMGVNAQKGGYYRYPINKKIEIQRQIMELATKYGMSFATCGDEDPSFHTAKNCCGTDGLKLFDNAPMCVYDTMFNICKEKGSVSLDDMLQHYCANKKEFIKQWEKGYFMEVLINVEYDRNSNTYKFVEKNSVMKKTYNPDNYQIELF